MKDKIILYKPTKVRGSYQFDESTKSAISDQAVVESRTFNNMLEELARRALAAQ